MRIIAWIEPANGLVTEYFVAEGSSRAPASRHFQTERDAVAWVEQEARAGAPVEWALGLGMLLAIASSTHALLDLGP